MAVLLDRTGGVAEIALTILCMLLACLPGLSARMMYPIFWFFSTVISWICYGLAFYAIGVSFSPQPCFSELDRSGSANLGWSAILLVGLANSIICRSIPDPQQHLCASYQEHAQMVFMLVLISSPWSIGIGPRVPFWILLSALFFMRMAKERSRLLSSIARSCTKEDLLISEYMAKTQRDETGHPSECHYIVSCQVPAGTMWPRPTMGLVPRWAGKNRLMRLLLGYASTSGVTRYDKLVTVQDIWKHVPAYVGKKYLNGRDVCLSFALFKLLRRRFRGCNLHESGLGMTRVFALQALLSDTPSSPRKSSFIPMIMSLSFSHAERSPRAFKIIEAELGFLFDFFYGTHLPDLNCLLSTILFIGWTTVLSFVYYYNFRDEHKTHGIHIIATASTIFFLFPILGIGQLPLALSNWNKVTLLVHICQISKRRRLSSSRESTTTSDGDPPIMLGLLARLVLRLPFTSRSSWSNQVRQYCLLCHHDSSHFATMQIPTKAKEALVNVLVDTLGHRDAVLSDGQFSLSRNGQHDKLSWACRQEFVAEKIIVWHVATTLCQVGYAENAPVTRTQRKDSRGSKIDEDHEVATMISGYCAYLVGFAPELISDDMYATRMVFHNACASAMEKVRGEGSLARMCESAKSMTFGSSSGTDFAAAAKLDVISQGKLLAAQLLKLQDDILWTVLADFWAELMLFISPADNAPAHLEKLRTGGELITHIWALLTHAGILERPSIQKDYEPSPPVLKRRCSHSILEVV